MTKSMLEKGTRQAVLLHKKPAFCNYGDDCKVHVQPVIKKYFLCCSKWESNFLRYTDLSHLLSE